MRWITRPAPLSAALAMTVTCIAANAAVTVKVSPATMELRTGATKKFAATVSGTSNKTVTWMVNGTPGGSPVFGTIGTDGMYTAPAQVPTPNTVEIAARSAVENVTGSAALTLLNPVPKISLVEPSSFNVGPFTLKLTGAGFLPTSLASFGGARLRVTYVSSTELNVSGSSDAANQSFALTVINPNPGASTSNEKTVKVLPPIAVSVSPATRKMRAGEKYDFGVSVTNTSNRTVTWAVNGVVGGNATVGTIDTDGVYQSPAQMPPGTMTPDGVEVKITATSVAAPTVVGTGSAFVRNALPVITAATPSAVAPGPISLVIQGTGFAQGARVRFGASEMTVTSVTPTSIAVTGTAAPTPAGLAPIIVSNPDPGAGVSNAASVSISVTGILSRQAAARFLELATFGPTPPLVARLQREGTGPYLDEQLNMPQTSVYADPMPESSSLTPMRRRFFTNAVGQPDQLRQRMAFALSQLFVVSAATVGNDYQMIPYQRMLAANAFGNYYDVLRGVTLSPTMGRYLDMVNNAKADPKKGTQPNENYAREVLQLFSVGLFRLNPDGTQQRDSTGAPIATYDETVIANLARVFTGWTYPTRLGAVPIARNPAFYEGPMEPWEANHDTGQKTLMDGYIIPPGRTANEDLELALGHIFNHPNVGPFVATRLIRHFAMSNPSPAYVGRVAAVFNNNGAGVRGDLKAVLRAILTDPEVQASTPTGGHLREPVLYAMALARSLGATVAEENSFNTYTNNMAQNLFQSPSVFNYFSPGFRIQNGTLFGPEFQIYTPSNAVDRANFAYRLIRSGVGGVAVNIDDFIGLAADPEALLTAIDNALYQGRMPDYLRQAIRPAIDATRDNRTRARNALQIAALAGDFMVIH